MTFEQFNDFVRLAELYRSGRTTASFIARAMSVSERHVRRLLRDLTPPTPRKAWNRIDDDMRTFLVEAKKETPAYNCQWLSELASDRFGTPVSQSSVWRILRDANLTPPHQTAAVLRERFETEHSADLVQMDTTWGFWLGARRLYLILLLDDHSRLILHGKFFLEETLWHNMDMIRETIEKHGTFRVLYTDNAVWFKAIRHNRSRFETHTQASYESEITRACRDLGIVHVTHKPYEPQGKGKIERLFRFIQERFVSQLDDPEMALWLVNKKFVAWMDWYNTKHTHRTTGQTPQKRFEPQRFKPLSVTERRKLDDIFCIRETRTVDKCNEFRYGGQHYHIPGSDVYAHRRVDLHIHPHSKMRIWYKGRFLCELPII